MMPQEFATQIADRCLGVAAAIYPRLNPRARDAVNELIELSDTGTRTQARHLLLAGYVWELLADRDQLRPDAVDWGSNEFLEVARRFVNRKLCGKGSDRYEFRMRGQGGRREATDQWDAWAAGRTAGARGEAPELASLAATFELSLQTEDTILYCQRAIGADKVGMLLDIMTLGITEYARMVAEKDPKYQRPDGTLDVDRCKWAMHKQYARALRKLRQLLQEDAA